MHIPAWMWFAAIPAAALAVFGVVAISTLRRFAARHTWPVIIFRAATGHHLDGRHRTDRTALRKGTRPAKASGQTLLRHTSRWSRQPRMVRAAAFWTPVIIIPALAAGAVLAPLATFAIAAAAAWAGVMLGCHRTVAWITGRAHRRTVIHPAAHALAPKLRMSPAVVASTLHITDRYTAAVPGQVLAEIRALPDHWAGTDADVAFVENLLRTRIPAPMDFDWDMTRFPGRMRAICAAAPPELVLASEHADLMDGLPLGQYFLGLDTSANPRCWDSDAEDPHLAVNARTRRGKTNTILSVAAQGLRRGELVTGIDPKRISLTALEGVPGFTLANDPGNVGQMWAAIRLVRMRMDTAITTGDKTRRELLVLEEVNQLHGLFRAHWESVKPQGARLSDAPPWADCRAILYQGAEFGFRLIVGGQDLNAAVLFGARSAFGTIMMGGYTSAQWRNIAGTSPIPPPPARRGRFALVHGEGHQWLQAVIVDPDPKQWHYNEAGWRTYALGGAAPQPEPAATFWTSARQWAAPRTRRAIGYDQPAAIPPVIIGIAAAAAYLNMDKPSFERARRRNPITGEFTTDIHHKRGQPAWRRETLDDWRAAHTQSAANRKGTP